MSEGPLTIETLRAARKELEKAPQTTEVLGVNMRNLSALTDEKMDIVETAPPNITAIEKVFPGVGKPERGVIFAYEKIIYNPGKIKIPIELMAHEFIHGMQQNDAGVEFWWDRYLTDPEFRLVEEIEAHRVEFQQFVKAHNRHMRRKYLVLCSARLAGPLYGKMISRTRAADLIQS